MKKILRRFCAGIMALVILVCLFPIAALALSVQEKEDLFRIDSLLSDGGYDENLEWLLDSNNFIYHKQAQIKDQDFWYCVLNAFDVNPIKIAKAFANDDFSSLWSLNGEYKESMKAVILSLAVNNNFQETAEIMKKEKVEHMYEYVIAAKKYASSTTKYSSLCDSFVESSLYQICESYIDGGQKQIEQQIAMRFGDDSQLCEEMFGEFVSSSDYISFIKAGFEYIDYSSELLEIAKYSYDALAELETYCHQDQQYIDFLRYLYQHSDSYDIVAASGELLTKFTSEYDTNYQEAINDIYAKVCESAGEYALEEVVELITNKLGISSILSGINWGISAAKLVSNYFFNTSEMIDIIVSIRAYDELSQYIGTIVKEKSATYTNYFGSYEGKATLASELIYYIELLWQIRRNGENAFFRFRNVLYEAQVTSFAFTFGHAADDLSSLNQWYGDTMSRFATIYGSLFSEIDSSLFDGLYEYPIEPDKFEIVDRKLIKYNGGDYNIHIPSEVVTIGSGAFTGINIGTVSFEGEIIESNAFSNCSRLYSLYLTKAITTIEDDAFVDCPNLTIYGYRGTYAETYAMDNGIPFEAWDINWDAEDIYNDFVIENNVLVDYVGDGGDVHIPYGVTRIGNSAFYNCSSLISVMIPDSVIEIDWYAFQDCNNLQSVVIPDSVTSIGYRAFYGCGSLTSVVIPDSVTEVELGAFEECANLCEMTLPFVGGSATEDTYLGYIFGSDSKYGYEYVPSTLKTIRLSDIYTTIGEYAFYNCSELTSIEVSDSVTSIGKYAFSGCSKLTAFEMPNNVTSIGEYSFNGCSALTSITIPDSVTRIGNWAFGGCISLETVHISDVGAWCNIDFSGSCSSPLYYADNLYLNGELITDISIPDGIEQIPQYAFSISDLESITIPNSVKSIGYSAFSYCNNLKSIIIPTGVSSIGSHAFFNCDNLTDVYISESVNSIGFNAFANCFELQNVYITDMSAWCNIDFSEGSNPMEYAINMYLDETLVTEIDIPNGVNSIGKYAFSGFNKLTSVVIPDSVVSIGEFAFMDCTKLADITIPNSVEEIGEAAFYNCSRLANIDVEIGNTNYCSIEGVLFSKDMQRLICYPAGKANTAYTIPNNVVSIDNWAFYECSNLTNITLLEGVIDIGDQAFSFCSSLTNIDISHSVTSIGDSAFRYCTSLVSITLPNGVTNIGEDAFAYCWNLTNITITSSVTSIGTLAFQNCENLTIICAIGSYAENYAKEYNIPIVYADSPKAVSIASLPNKLVYPINGMLVTDGLSLNIVLEDGSQTTVTTGYTVEDYDFSTEGTKTITVTFAGLTTNFEVTVDSSVIEYPESTHPYDNDIDQTWIYTHPTDADSLKVTFSENTETEYSWDWIHVYDKDNNLIGSYTGTELAGKTIEIPGNTFRINLVSDSSNVANGFTVTNVEAVVSCKHVYGEWVETNEPTCTSTGQKYRICSRCGQEETQTIAVLGHDYSSDVTDSTCTEDGFVQYSCSTCGHSFTETIPAYHKWSDEWTVDIEPTETSEGSQSRHCTRCDAKTDVIVIPMLSTESPATDFEYSIRNNEVTINAYIGTSGIMNIPTHIEGYPVTTISAFAFSGNATIAKATIPYTVTNIKYYAFNNCSELLEVNLGSGITVLPESLFSRCGKLQKVSLPTNLTTIQSNAFYYCESLVDMSIPDSVEIIEDSAFYECLWHQSMTEDTVVGTGILLRLNTEFGEDVVIPNGVQTVYACLGEYAFTNTYVDQVTLPASITSWNQVDLGVRTSSYVVDEDNKYFTAVDGVIYSKDMSTVVAVPSRMAEELSLPETVTTIGSGAFYSSNLSKITLHKGVIELKEGAFSYCSNLTEITIPDSVISIENNAFRGGNDNLVILCGLGSCAAAYAADNNISFRILATPKELSIASLPSKLTYPIGGTLDLSDLSLSAVYEDGTNATVSTGYTVSDYDFSTAGTKVITVSLGELSVTFEVVVDPNLVVYPESDHPYANNSNQTWNYIHPSGADQLIITFSNDTETENNYDKMYIYDGNGNEVGVYSGAQLAGASITVNGNKFSIKLTSDSSVAKNGFTVVSVEAIILCDHSYGEWIERTAPSCTVDGVEYRTCSVCGNEENQAIAAIGHNWETEWTVDVEPTETSEGSKSRHCINCEATVDVIVIPMLNVSPVEDFVYTVNNSTVTIADYIGTDTTVTIPSSIDGYPVTTIGVYAFADCTDLTRIVIPSSITVVGNWAFSNCTGLTNITIPDSVTYIGIFAFNNCSNLTDITVGNGVVTIGDSAFSNCTSLIRINISRSVANIGNYVFSGCNSLNGIWVDANNHYYSSDDQGVLYNKSKTKLIRAPGGLGSVTIPNSVTNIGISAFSYSNMLSSVVIPSSVTSIGEYAFYDCTKLKAVYYCGAKDQWDAVVVSDNNTTLENAVRYIGEISFAGASLSLQHNLAINYKVDKALFEDVGYTDPYVIFELNGVKTKVSSYTFSGDRYIFAFRNIAPNQMNDTIKATLYATYNGEVYSSATREYSVAEYCYSMLDLYAADQNAELRTLLVDLLNYGAASQTYTGYRTDALVNTSLTDSQLLWGTSAEPALDTVLDTAYKTVENPTAKWKGAGLHLQESVSMRLRFTAESIDGLSVKIESGTNTWTIASDKFLKEDGVYYVYFTGLDAGQMRQSVYLTIYDGDTPVSNTVCYSIGSYAYEKQNSTIAGLPELVKAMMKYGDSAYAYVY